MTVLSGTVPDICPTCDGHGWIGDFVAGEECGDCNGIGHDEESLRQLLEAGECELYPDYDGI